MARPKSELTGIQCTICIRLTPSLKAEYKRLGDAKWLRKVLALSIQERNKNDLLSNI